MSDFLVFLSLICLFILCMWNLKISKMQAKINIGQSKINDRIVKFMQKLQNIKDGSGGE